MVLQFEYEHYIDGSAWSVGNILLRTKHSTISHKEM